MPFGVVEDCPRATAVACWLAGDDPVWPDRLGGALKVGDLEEQNCFVL